MNSESECVIWLSNDDKKEWNQWTLPKQCPMGMKEEITVKQEQQKPAVRSTTVTRRRRDPALTKIAQRTLGFAGGTLMSLSFEQ